VVFGTGETSLSGLTSLASVTVVESMGGGAVVGTPVDDTKPGTSGECSVDKVGEMGTGNGEKGIAKFGQK
jgi:hypothetical protein